MINEFDIKEHASACSKWSADTSKVLRGALVFSVLVLGISWNLRPSNWLDGRIRFYKSALERGASGQGDILLRRYSVAEIRHRVEYLEELQLKRASFHAPVVDLDFDINDLGVISGVTFLAFMLWLRICLLREELTLNLAFERARRAEQLQPFYELATISQAPLILRRRRALLFWSYAPVIAYSFPLLAQVYLTDHDYQTYYYGRLFFGISASQALFIAILSVVGLLVITTSCGMAVRRLHILWLAAEREVSSTKELAGESIGTRTAANPTIERTETAEGAVPAAHL
jgi:hypothetical protein